jgi:uncharacterized protein (DUF885 family)
MRPCSEKIPQWRLLVPAAIVAATLTAGLAALGQSEDAKLENFFKEHLEATFRQQPSYATALGDHRFDGLLEDLSLTSREAWVERDRKALESLPRRVDYGKLTRSGQIEFEILRDDLSRSIWLAENMHPFREDPRAYNDYISDSIYVVLSQSTLPRETNISNALARMEHIPAIIGVARQTLENPPRVHTETAIRQNQGAIAFFEKGILDLAGNSPQRELVKASGTRVAEALRGYQAFLEKDLLPRANGEWRIGRERFYKKLELTLDAGLTADQVLADAQVEFERVQRELYVISRQLWSRYFPNLALPPDDPDGRRETIQKVVAAVGREHGKPEKLVSDVRRTVRDIKRFIHDRDILRLPEPDTCRIVEMPEFKRGNSTAYMQSAPPLDPKSLGFFAVSPPPKDWDAARVESYLEEYNSHMNQILTIHEAYPGHYVQLEYANRQPSLIRKLLGSGVYVEGWAVYTEQMMLDQGYGNGNLQLRLNQLKFYLRAVANAILDHRMHCTQMTDDEALTFLTRDAYQSEGEARLKIIRAKQSSVQLSTYFVGRMAMYRLRQSVERELGDKFQLGRYHEAVLEPGSVPVKYLPELVRTRLQQR